MRTEMEAQEFESLKAAIREGRDDDIQQKTLYSLGDEQLRELIKVGFETLSSSKIQQDEVVAVNNATKKVLLELRARELVRRGSELEQSASAQKFCESLLEIRTQLPEPNRNNPHISNLIYNETIILAAQRKGIDDKLVGAELLSLRAAYPLDAFYNPEYKGAENVTAAHYIDIDEARHNQKSPQETSRQQKALEESGRRFSAQREIRDAPSWQRPYLQLKEAFSKSKHRVPEREEKPASLGTRLRELFLGPRIVPVDKQSFSTLGQAQRKYDDRKIDIVDPKTGQVLSKVHKLDIVDPETGRKPFDDAIRKKNFAAIEDYLTRDAVNGYSNRVSLKPAVAQLDAQVEALENVIEYGRRSEQKGAVDEAHLKQLESELKVWKKLRGQAEKAVKKQERARKKWERTEKAYKNWESAEGAALKAEEGISLRSINGLSPPSMLSPPKSLKSEDPMQNQGQPPGTVQPPVPLAAPAAATAAVTAAATAAVTAAATDHRGPPPPARTGAPVSPPPPPTTHRGPPPPARTAAARTAAARAAATTAAQSGGGGEGSSASSASGGNGASSASSASGGGGGGGSSSGGDGTGRNLSSVTDHPSVSVASANMGIGAGFTPIMPPGQLQHPTTALPGGAAAGPVATSSPLATAPAPTATPSRARSVSAPATPGPVPVPGAVPGPALATPAAIAAAQQPAVPAPAPTATPAAISAAAATVPVPAVPVPAVPAPGLTPAPAPATPAPAAPAPTAGPAPGAAGPAPATQQPAEPTNELNKRIKKFNETMNSLEFWEKPSSEKLSSEGLSSSDKIAELKSTLLKEMREFDEIAKKAAKDKLIDSPDPNTGETPLIAAIRLRNFQAANVLIRHGADITKKGIDKSGPEKKETDPPRKILEDEIEKINKKLEEFRQQALAVGHGPNTVYENIKKYEDILAEMQRLAQHMDDLELAKEDRSIREVSFDSFGAVLGKEFAGGRYYKQTDGEVIDSYNPLASLKEWWGKIKEFGQKSWDKTKDLLIGNWKRILLCLTLIYPIAILIGFAAVNVVNILARGGLAVVRAVGNFANAICNGVGAVINAIFKVIAVGCHAIANWAEKRGIPILPGVFHTLGEFSDKTGSLCQNICKFAGATCKCIADIPPIFNHSTVHAWRSFVHIGTSAGNVVSSTINEMGKQIQELAARMSRNETRSGVLFLASACKLLGIGFSGIAEDVRGTVLVATSLAKLDPGGVTDGVKVLGNGLVGGIIASGRAIQNMGEALAKPERITQGPTTAVSQPGARRVVEHADLALHAQIGSKSGQKQAYADAKRIGERMSTHTGSEGVTAAAYDHQQKAKQNSQHNAAGHGP